MKCCNRSTLGVVIGIIHLILYVAVIAISIAILPQVRSLQDQDFIDLYEMLYPGIIVLCVIMLITSGLLITGIVKKRHKLMLPWIILSAIMFIINFIRTFFIFICFVGLLVIPTNTLPILNYLFFNFLGIAIPAVILWFIYKLYKDIREDSASKTSLIMNPAPIDYSHHLYI